MWGVREQKRRRRRNLFLSVVALLQIISWVSATSRPLTPHDGDDDAIHKESLMMPPPLNSKQVFKSLERAMGNEEYKGLSTLGSRPPSCTHRCGRCVPCQAIQVPTTSDELRTQYANYEPEGWKCKCGVSFYDP